MGLASSLFLLYVSVATLLFTIGLITADLYQRGYYDPKNRINKFWTEVDIDKTDAVGVGIIISWTWPLVILGFILLGVFCGLLWIVRKVITYVVKYVINRQQTRRQNKENEANFLSEMLFRLYPILLRQHPEYTTDEVYSMAENLCKNEKILVKSLIEGDIYEERRKIVERKLGESIDIQRPSCNPVRHGK